jgi:uncharacterized protein (TIGR03435 family)
VQAAPAGLAVAVTAAVKGAAVGSSTLALVKGALKLMAWTKMKTAIVAGVVVLFAAGISTITIKEIRGHHFDNSWRTENLDPKKVSKVLPEVGILPSNFRPYGWGYGFGYRRGKIMGVAWPAKEVVGAAYDFNLNTRIVLPIGFPEGSYDFIASLPNGNQEALQEAVQRTFGVVVKRETVETNVLLLTVKIPNASGLRSSANRRGGISLGDGEYKFVNQSITNLNPLLEGRCAAPVIDRTGLTGNYDFDLKWDEQRDNKGQFVNDNLKQALLDQLGLELVPSREPVEMLVVENAK